MTRPRPLIVFALCAFALPASAQDAGNAWTLVEDDGTITAAVAYASGPGIAVRCLPENALQVILSGLPAAGRTAFTRSLEVSRPDGELGASIWVNALDRTTAYAMAPSFTARGFRTAERFTVRAPTSGGRYTRLELDLPRDTDALDRVLQACGRALEDPEDLRFLQTPDTEQAPPLHWAERPSPNFPARAMANRVSRGVAALDCRVVETGRLESCRVEAEFPYGMGFGAEAVRSAERARLNWNPSGGRARFSINFHRR